MVEVHKRAKGNHFNILGFFGCCFHCKHEPTCTSKCMNKHHIQNGFGDHEEEGRSEAMSQERLMEASETMVLMQTQESEHYHRHKPIKLVLPEGSSRYHDAPERPTNTGSAKDVKKDSANLQAESDTTNDFNVNSFFHCAYGCKHEIKCEKRCMNRHGVVE